MLIPEVVIFADGLQPILRKFTLSGKSSSLLNDALDIMETKTTKLMVWCTTTMANLFDCCLNTLNILVPLYDTLVSCVIKKEEAAYFISPICFSVLHVMTGNFRWFFFRKK